MIFILSSCQNLILLLLFLILSGCTHLPDKNKFKKPQEANEFLCNRKPTSLVPSCQVLANGNQPAPANTLDTAVEIELEFSPQVLSILTTEDGTIRSLLNGAPLPSVVRMVARRVGHRGDPKDLPWDSLDNKSKISVLKQVTRSNWKPFFQQRKIQGLKVRDFLEVEFLKETILFGKTYPAGTQKIDLTGVFHDVEYCCNDKGKRNLDMLELHVRSPGLAGDVAMQVWDLLDALDIPRTHLHVHMLAPMPMKVLDADPYFQALLMSDYYRRANLMAEIMSVYFYNRDIKDKSMDDITYMSFANPDDFGRAAKYLFNIANRVDDNLEDTLKIGWVGFWGTDKYDQPNLWGLEYRVISANYDPKIVRPILNSIQQGMLLNSYGISQDRMKRWMDHFVGWRPTKTKVSKAISEACYHQTWENLVSKPPRLLQRFLGFQGRFEILLLSEDFQSLVANKEQIKMLAYDWRQDPLFWGNHSAIQTIERAQRQALQRIQQEIFESPNLENADELLREIMKEFLVKSQIMATVFMSFGISFAFEDR